jgi:sec-independent protein translocase protein TatA
MGTFSIWHWLVVLLVILLLFGSGKISSLMGDLAKGIKSFRQNMREDENKDASMAADAQAAPAQPAGSLASPAQPAQAQPAAAQPAQGQPAQGAAQTPPRPAA